MHARTVRHECRHQLLVAYAAAQRTDDTSLSPGPSRRTPPVAPATFSSAERGARLLPRGARRWLATSGALALLFLGRTALADKVLVLPFQAVGAVPEGELAQANAATSAATTRLGHKLPSASEATTAQAAVKDGVADTTEEYRAAGRASGADWTLAGQVEAHGATYRVELEACQIPSGRVESLAREIDPTKAESQVAEMLALLVRPEGIANAVIPWERAANAPPPPPAPAPPPPVPATPPPPPPPPAERHAYAEKAPFAIGLSGSVLGALHRNIDPGVPSSDVGAGVVGTLGGTIGYAFAAVPGLELRADGDGSIAGPHSASFAGGARYAFPLAPTLRLYAGPEAELGTFVTLGGDKTARFLLRADVFVALGLGEHVQLEAAAVFDAAVGSTALDLAGGALRALVRF